MAVNDLEKPTNLWRWVELGEISEVVRKGTTPTTLGFSFVKVGVPFLRAEDISGGIIDSHSVAFHIDPITHNSALARSNLKPGDLLITIAGSLGRVGYVPNDAPPLNCNQAVAFIRLRPNLVDVKFACFACQHKGVASSLVDLKKVGTIGNLNLQQIREFRIPLPPLPEQKRIAAILEKADRLRRQCHYAVELSNTYLQSVFLDMFGDPASNPRNWKIQSLVSISQRFSDGPFGSNLKTEHYTSSGIRVIRLQNIGNGQLIDDDKAYISEAHFASLGKYRCLPGDVIVGTLGDPNLRACILPDSIPIALNKADCVQIRTNPDVAIAEYICWLLNMPHTLFMATGMIHGQTRSRMNMGRLAELQVPVAPLPLQQKFAQIVQKLERLRAQQHEAERQAAHLFQTLLHQAFEGNSGLGSEMGQDEVVKDGVQASVVSSELTRSYVQLQMKY